MLSMLVFEHFWSFCYYVATLHWNEMNLTPETGPFAVNWTTCFSINLFFWDYLSYENQKRRKINIYTQHSSIKADNLKNQL